MLERIARDTYSDRGSSTISPTQWATMRYLRRASGESHTPLHIARFLGVTPAPASRTIASLERRGYVARRPNPSDRRSVLIDLTELGHRVLGEDPIERLAVAVDRLNAMERRALETSLENIAILLAVGSKENLNGLDSGG